MTDKELGENWEKETIRRQLLASTISLADLGGFNSSHGRFGNIWKRLVKRARLC